MRDGVAVKAIRRRVARLQAGLSGDARPVGGGVSELRIDHGPGYGIDFVGRSGRVVMLLCGGDKGSQARDIARALALAAEIEE